MTTASQLFDGERAVAACAQRDPWVKQMYLMMSGGPEVTWVMCIVCLLLCRHPSWRSEETQERERSRTGSESSQTGPSATSGRSKSDKDGKPQLRRVGLSGALCLD